MMQLWDQRRILVTSADPAERHAASQRLQVAVEALSPWRVYIEILVNEARAQLHAAESRLLQNEVATGGHRRQRRRSRRPLHRCRLRAGAYDDRRRRSSGAALDRDGAAKDREGDWRARAITTWLELKDSRARCGNSSSSPSRTRRSSTATRSRSRAGSPSARASAHCFLFLLGYWVIGRLARHVERWMVRKGLNAERVRTFRRWIVAVMSFALVLLTLNLARIPLSVFAFLGGALAIGVGFGTQTIIKNFISGMILLVERRVQIGDVIEIDGVEGTVTTVDLRSSTVRAATAGRRSFPTRCCSSTRCPTGRSRTARSAAVCGSASRTGPRCATRRRKSRTARSGTAMCSTTRLRRCCSRISPTARRS
jgi:hypothetical protein